MQDLFKNRYRIPTTRLKNWDYSSTGWYYVTICTYEKKCYFGEIINKKVVLSNIGRIANRFWLEIPKHFENVLLDEHIVMPNHLHGIIVIKYPVETLQCNVSTNTYKHKNQMAKISPKPKSLSTVIRSFKSIFTREINKSRSNKTLHWQSRFYDHIIRSEESLQKIREYIRLNPLKWDLDENNPNYVKTSRWDVSTI